MKPLDFLSPTAHFQHISKIKDPSKRSYEMDCWMKRTDITTQEEIDIARFTGYTKYGSRGILTNLRKLMAKGEQL